MYVFVCHMSMYIKIYIGYMCAHMYVCLHVQKKKYVYPVKDLCDCNMTLHRKEHCV